ncbi:unnamed protein product [Lota lota]
MMGFLAGVGPGPSDQHNRDLEQQAGLTPVTTSHSHLSLEKKKHLIRTTSSPMPDNEIDPQSLCAVIIIHKRTHSHTHTHTHTSPHISLHVFCTTCSFTDINKIQDNTSH